MLPRATSSDDEDHQPAVDPRPERLPMVDAPSGVLQPSRGAESGHAPRCSTRRNREGVAAGASRRSRSHGTRAESMARCVNVHEGNCVPWSLWMTVDPCGGFRSRTACRSCRRHSRPSERLDSPERMSPAQPREAREVGVVGVQLGLILVTHNTKHFRRVRGLKTADWV